MQWLLGNSQWLNGRGPNLRSTSPEAQLKRLLSGARDLKIFWPSPKYWFQDVEGKIPVTLPGQPIRRWNTIDGGSFYLTQPTSDDKAPRSARMPNGNWMARFDGVDDWMRSVTTLNWSASARAMVMLGMRKLGTGQSCVLEQGQAASSSPGWSVFAPIHPAAYRTWLNGGGSNASTSLTDVLLDGDNTTTLTGLFDIIAKTVTHRVGGIASSPTTNPSLAGTLADDFLNIGSRNAGSAFLWPGYMGPLVLHEGSIPPDATLLLAETIINNYMTAPLHTQMLLGARAAYTLIADPRYWFQDVAGTIPVTAPGQPIRRWVTVDGKHAFIQPVSDDRAPRSAVLPNGQWNARFDGVDDYLVSETAIPFGASAEVSWIVGARKLRDAVAHQFVVVAGSNPFTGAGFGSFSPPSGGYWGSAIFRTNSNKTIIATDANMAGQSSAVIYTAQSNSQFSVRINGNDIGTAGEAPVPQVDAIVTIGSRGGAGFLQASVTEVSIRVGMPLANPVPAEKIVNQHLGGYGPLANPAPTVPYAKVNGVFRTMSTNGALLGTCTLVGYNSDEPIWRLDDTNNGPTAVLQLGPGAPLAASPDARTVTTRIDVRKRNDGQRILLRWGSSNGVVYDTATGLRQLQSGSASGALQAESVGEFWRITFTTTMPANAKEHFNIYPIYYDNNNAANALLVGSHDISNVVITG